MYSEKIARYLIPMGGKLTLRYDSRQLAKDFGLPILSDLLVDTAKAYHAVQDLFFEKAILHAHTVDDSILYLDNRNIGLSRKSFERLSKAGPSYVNFMEYPNH